MKITSKAFENKGNIPSKYTCDESGLSVPLEFHDTPEDTKTLVLIVDDPDVPKSLKEDGVFDHWLVWDMPADTDFINENETPAGVIGKNTGGEYGYAPMCPPDSEHRYFFKLYALDTELDLSPESTDKATLLLAMEEHILETAELIGLYERPDDAKTM